MGHKRAAAERQCPVPVVRHQGTSFDDPETWMHFRTCLGFAAAFREWCTVPPVYDDEVVVQETVTRVAKCNGVLVPFRDHRPVRVGNWVYVSVAGSNQGERNRPSSGALSIVMVKYQYWVSRWVEGLGLA